MTSSVQDEEKRPREGSENGGDTAITIDESDDRPQSEEKDKKDAKVGEKEENKDSGGGGFSAYRVRQASRSWTIEVL